MAFEDKEESLLVLEQKGRPARIQDVPPALNYLVLCPPVSSEPVTLRHFPGRFEEEGDSSMFDCAN
jgi:hypothetical protein